MSCIGRDRPLLSRFEFAFLALNLVAEGPGDDLELLDLVVVVMIRRGCGRFLPLSLIRQIDVK